MAVVAATLPEGNPWKIWVIWAIPSVSMVASVGWEALTVFVANRLREREARRLLSETKLLLQRQLDEPSRSAASTREARATLERLERLEVARLIEAVRRLDVITSADGPVSPSRVAGTGPSERAG